MSVVNPFTYSGDNLVFTVDGKPYKVSKGDRNFNAVAKALKDGKHGQELVAIFKDGVDLNEALKDVSRVTFDGSYVYVDGERLHDNIVQKVRDISSAGLPVQPILRFIEKVRDNPSFNSRNQLYEFLQHSDIALTEDGDFIAYRAVRNDYMSKHQNLDGTRNRNMVGDVVEMDRSEIDDNPNNHCSAGLHVGSIKYAGQGGFYHNSGDRTMLVKVNPANVVSVPNDHSCQKCRVSKYAVVGEVSEPLLVPLFTTEGKPYPVEYTDASNFEGFDYDDDDDYDYDDYDSEWDDEDDYDSEVDFDDELSEDELPPEIEV